MNTTPASKPPAADDARDRPTWLGRIARAVWLAGEALVKPPKPGAPTADAPAEATPASSPERPRFDLTGAAMRVSLLRQVAEQLRGAADGYIAAKLDEIEARVDAKLDVIEERIDRKVSELHEKLREARDAELRHRLRLLKITLVFTVLVAVVSLGYKLFSKLLVG
ncbi:MAG: hypothetical protein LC135_13550 [Phycisphaerae bacterium]|nr:hypothetical protein [Phycisphaerae bacterium]MCZ2400876.1 hypothetical protein [Phycisphaerae bacterium]